MSDYEELVRLVRRMLERPILGYCHIGDDEAYKRHKEYTIEAVDAQNAVENWLREHDAREEVRTMSREDVQAELQRCGIDCTAAAQKVIASVRAIEAESRQARKELEQ